LVIPYTKQALFQPIQHDKLLAQEIIEQLRYGSAPCRGATLLSVGREQILKEITQQLCTISKGKSSLKIINGAWGIGKSQMLYMLQERALKSKFAVSLVTLSPRECPLYDLIVVYQNIMKHVCTEEYPDCPALEQILHSWAQSVRKKYIQTNEKALSLKRINLEFKQALTIYYTADSKNDQLLVNKTLSWFYGDMVSSREAQKASLPSVVSTANALERLGNISIMIRELGYQGLVILFDEAETISSIYSPQSQNALSNLIAFANTANKSPFTYFIYATTPDFFSHLKNDNRNLGIASQRTILLANLNHSELVELALRIKEIHFVAENWDGDSRTQDKKLSDIVGKLVNGLQGKLTPRDLVKSIITYLDICHGNPNVTSDEILSDILRTLAEEM